MKQKSFLLFAVLTCIIYSCKKDRETDPVSTPPSPPSYANYSQLTVGNYWIYEEYNIDRDGLVTASGKYDSCYVQKDTTINAKKYFKIIRPSFNSGLNEIIFERDSLHYIVTSEGKKIFSSEDFTNELSAYYFFVTDTDTLCRINNKMTDRNSITIVPAGSFTTSNVKETYSIYPKFAGAGNTRYRNHIYALHVGIVSEILPFYIFVPGYTERRLIRYHISK